MTRGGTLAQPLDAALLVQRALTVALSAHNALFFARFRSRRHPRRRLGATVLVFINLALAGESLAFSLIPQVLGHAGRGITLGSQVVVASVSLAVAIAIAALILRQRLRR